MSAAKHTPGPWTTAPWGTGQIGIYSPEGHSLASTNSKSKNGRKAEIKEADARLIAAAPELLEFAEEVRRSGDTRLASMAIAIIAKAKGGA